MTHSNSVDIERRTYAIPGTYLHKPYQMTIFAPIHNYMVTKRRTSYPYVILSRDDIRYMIKRLNELLVEQQQQPRPPGVPEDDDEAEDDYTTEEIKEGLNSTTKGHVDSDTGDTEDGNRFFLTLQGAQTIQNDKVLQIVLKNIMKRLDIIEKGYTMIQDGDPI